MPSDDVKSCLHEVYRALRPGGVLVCSFYNAFATGKNWITDMISTGYHYTDEAVPGLRMTEISKLQDFGLVRGVGWALETTVIETPEGHHVFKDKERFRLFTYWDMHRYLTDAGYKELHCYVDWKVKSSKKSKVEQLVFVARK